MSERLEQPQVRDVEAADVAEVVRLRAASWRAAYADLMPPAYLDAMDTGPEAVGRAVRRLRGNPAGYHDLVALRGDRIVAFALAGPERPMPSHYRDGGHGCEEHGGTRGEVYALYAHPDAWSTGAGAALLDAACARLRADGHRQQVLWVLEGNARGRSFYERQGLRPTGERTTLRLGGALLTELQYATVPAAEQVVSQRSVLPGLPAPVRRGA
ncbi:MULTISPECIES: GNAT family N-acetyltransferase [Streptacidiphilus]|uniref:N-acetyltransferase family protein n=2 Tax=Streptacidiphilus TaxID=228398 RepID=A0ABV6V0T5_9ACTN|nr:GNAT family N-acetyltransferase [Streptacidiphilus jeojiense]